MHGLFQTRFLKFTGFVTSQYHGLWNYMYHYPLSQSKIKIASTLHIQKHMLLNADKNHACSSFNYRTLVRCA